ncbi:hypothetical protein O1611_g3932 [Lasiodiplodia mahajangana]|uniref:Uncharacterized protein n=1 Tax=Lasiodiplodia mahajangana TaxID=1108764 RepID=A0ACC2JQA8_9PEZI|nr:hypothetical protein O1611_g3932 [Lasiodiplodia mahajangana]
MPQDIALHSLALENRNRQLVYHLVSTIKSKRIDEDWYIKPGTVLRCDPDIEEGFSSVLFISLPTLHSGPYDGPLLKGEGICHGRKLQEALDQIGMPFVYGGGWFSKRTQMAQTNQPLWVRQMWILIAGSSILTYSNYPEETLITDNITIRGSLPETEDGGRLIQVMDQNRRLLFIPLAKCKSFFELKVAVVAKLVELGMEKDEIDYSSVHLYLSKSEELSARKWIMILKQGEIPLIRASLENASTDKSSRGTSTSPSSAHSSSGGTQTDDSISLDESQNSEDSDHESGPSDGDVDEVGFLLLRPESIASKSEFNLPELNRITPPFLSWLGSSHSQAHKEMHRGLKEAITRTESKLIRIDGKAYTDELMEDLYQAYGETDLYHAAEQLKFEEFRLQKLSLSKGNHAQKPFDTPSIMDEDAKSLAVEFFDVSLRVLESFIPTDFPSRLTSKFLGSLSMIIKDPARGSYFDDIDADAPDPELPGEFVGEGWVISRKLVSDGKLQGQLLGETGTNCKACERGVVYHNREKAATHLRRVHMLHSKSVEEMHYYLLPFSSALGERLREEYHGFFKTARDSMLSVLRKLIAIQDGVISNDEFREQRGLPYQLLEAFKWIIIFVCAVPRTLHDITWFYKDPMGHGYGKNLTSPNIQRQKELLLKVSSTIEDSIRSGERTLVSPTFTVGDKQPRNFVVSVGAHYIATKILCNILKMPIHSHKRVVSLYETHTQNLWSQVLRDPNKRQILSVGALKDGLGLVRRFRVAKGYTGLYQSRLVPRFEAELIQQEDHRLEKEIGQIDQLLENCDRISGQVQSLTEAMKDDQGRAIFIFTTVTVIFLPLGFVASYISMSGDTTGLDWDGRQKLFWETAGPLTIVVLILCLVVARIEDVVGALPVEWVEKVVLWKDSLMSKVRERADRGRNMENGEEVGDEVLD